MKIYIPNEAVKLVSQWILTCADGKLTLIQMLKTLASLCSVYSEAKQILLIIVQAYISSLYIQFQKPSASFSLQCSFASRQSGFNSTIWNAALFIASRRHSSRTHLRMREWRFWKIHLRLLVVAKPRTRNLNYYYNYLGE